MQNIKKYFMTLALLLTAVTGAWAQSSLNVVEFEVPAAWANDNSPVTAGDLPGFKASTLAEAEKWKGAPKTGNAMLIYAFDGNTINLVQFSNEAPIVGGSKAEWTKKQVFGLKLNYKFFITTEITEWPLTSQDGKLWTLAKMPANDIELQVEYFAESNIFLGKEALADKANIVVTAGELGVQFDEDGKSANTVTEGSTVTTKYNGTKKILGMKVEKKAKGNIVDLSTYSGTSYEVTEDVTFTGTTNNEISILYKGEGYEVTLDNVNAPKCFIAAQDDNYTVNVKLKGTSRLAGIYDQNADIIIGEAAAGGTVILFDESPLGGNGTTITINGGTVKAKASASSAVYDMLEVNGGAVYIEAAEDSKAVSIDASGSVTLYGWNGSAWETYKDHRYLSTDNSKAPTEWTW
ncbi:hypothetical protein M1D30_11145 [Prevotella sp. E15-22]|uniref:hypothetical protein n=1 Tax=Prevotella sp. E15-22 TaxID=2937774 RepID=UPI00206507FD|nr:hypothetical protein [Prevotella sp. E15-22]UPS44116.1 hypothetical protein M1D30_11145 [Prevotella sp. E15-22]